MHIRRARPEDLCRMAEIFVYANRLNSFPIFGDEAYSFSQLQVSAVLADFSGWIGEMGNAYVWDDGIVRGFVVSAGERCTNCTWIPSSAAGALAGRCWNSPRRKPAQAGCGCWRENRKARAFYEKHGFLPTGEWTYEEGTPEKLLLLKRGEAGHGR